MFETVVIATDGSESAERAVEVALDIADRFDADVHALCVVDERELSGAPEAVRDDLKRALEAVADESLESIAAHGAGSVSTAIREGTPTTEICAFAEDVDADMVALGTRGRHGDDAYLLGSVAEEVTRRCPKPVLTVRQLDGDEHDSLGLA